MPIFDYFCKNCEETVEKFVLDITDLNIVCGKCELLMVKSLSAPKTFILKGDGFYKKSKEEN